MKNLITVLIVASGFFFTKAICAQEFISDDQQAIMDVIQTAYVDGLQNEGDLEKVEDTKAEFNFTPSENCTIGEDVTLTFTAEGVKELKIKVEIEAKQTE